MNESTHKLGLKKLETQEWLTTTLVRFTNRAYNSSNPLAYDINVDVEICWSIDVLSMVCTFIRHIDIIIEVMFFTLIHDFSLQPNSDKPPDDLVMFPLFHHQVTRQIHHPHIIMGNDQVGATRSFTKFRT